MVWDKGIGEFIEAARILKTLMPEWRFILAGAADYKNPTSIPLRFLEDLNSESIVEWVGYVGDMTPYFAQASIVCLPSYREGMPKSLLEGAAAGCATVTSDAVGCREAIIPEVTGLLVPIRDSENLKNALQMLMEDRELRESFGRAGRNLAINQFGLDSVIKRTLSIYGEILRHEQIK
jgi:glycosyltransferase involved in cell wall biosynthesis